MTREKILAQIWRAEMYRLLALAFDEPQTATLRAIQTLATELLVAPQTPAALRFCLEDLRIQLPTDAALLDAEYQRLFHIHMACTPFEGSYHRAERGPVIGDIAAFYHAFGITPVAQHGPPDALKMELGFLCYLALKHAHALDRGAADGAHIIQKAEASFLRDHLGRWVPPFTERLHQTTTQRYLRACGALLQAWISAECVRYGVTPPPLPITECSGAETPVQCCMS